MVNSVSRSGVGRPGDVIANADDDAFGNCDDDRAVHGAANRVGHLAGQAFAGIAEKAVGGFEPARGQPAAVAVHEEQRDQRDQEQKQPA